MAHPNIAHLRFIQKPADGGRFRDGGHVNQVDFAFRMPARLPRDATS